MKGDVGARLNCLVTEQRKKTAIVWPKLCFYEQKPLEDFPCLNLFADYLRGDPIAYLLILGGWGCYQKGSRKAFLMDAHAEAFESYRNPGQV